MEIPRDLLFKIVLLIIFLAIIFVFKDQIFYLIEEAKGKYFSPPSEEKKEVLESNFESLGISDSDSPGIVMYKLFRNFNPNFLNEKIGSRTKYYPFILNLPPGNDYGYNSVLINNISEGVRNFSRFDNLYQIGRDGQQLATCDNPQYDGSINYNNDCWTPGLDITLGNMNTNINPCKILVHGDGSNRFNDKIKIRIGWLSGGTSFSTEREIIYTLITVCDG